jgi:type IV pilus assembly protein PilM
MRVKKIGSLPSVKVSMPPLAIDFGAQSLKILQISGGENPRIIAATQLDTPDEIVRDSASRLRFQIQALPKLIRKGKFSVKRAVCVLPATNMFCKHMRLQLGEGVDARSMVAATLPSQIGCPYETLICREHEVVGAGSGNKTEIICMAVSRDLVGRLMAAMKSAHLEPVGMHSPFHAVVRSFDSVKRREEDGSRPIMYLDLGYASTDVVIAHGSKIVFARTVDLGGLHLDEAIVSQRDVLLEQARHLRWKIPASEIADVEPSGESGSGGLAMLQAAIAREESQGGVAQEVSQDSASAATAEDRRVGDLTPGLSGQIGAATSGPAFPEGVNLSEQLEILKDEVAMCLRYHKSMFPEQPVDHAVLVGGETRQVWLCQALARGLRLSMHVGDPLSRLDRANAASRGVDLGKAQLGWAAALGACQSPTDL